MRSILDIDTLELGLVGTHINLLSWFTFTHTLQKKEYYVSFDLKVVNVKTSAIAYSRSIEGSAKAESKGSSFSGTIRGVSLGESKSKTTNVPVTRAVRAAMVESAEYLNCVLYLKDECVQEYEAKDEKRKRSNDSLDMF